MTEKKDKQQPWEASFKDDTTKQYSRTQNGVSRNVLVWLSGFWY